MDGLGCTLCPRRCGVPRGEGFCGAGAEMEVASMCVHRGEEPPLVGPDGRGIVNVFFAHCNLQCTYCQNWQISGRETENGKRKTENGELVDRICGLLPQSAGLVGLVTAAHYADHVPALVEGLHARGVWPTVVYNSGGYESVESLRRLEGLVDVYLPDLKYMDRELARRYSHAPDYPEVAAAALGEMRRQVGSGLTVEDGVARRGIIVRHLVLPGHTDNSLQCLEWLADHFNPFALHLSLMAQYYPPDRSAECGVRSAELSGCGNDNCELRTPNSELTWDYPQRTLTEDEYMTVVARAEELGLTAGWIQELESERSYRPDFGRGNNPFEL